MRNTTGIVLGQPNRQVVSQADIESARRGEGFQNIDIGEIFHVIRPVV